MVSWLGGEGLSIRNTRYTPIRKHAGAINYATAVECETPPCRVGRRTIYVIPRALRAGNEMPFSSGSMGSLSRPRSRVSTTWIEVPVGRLRFIRDRSSVSGLSRPWNFRSARVFRRAARRPFETFLRFSLSYTLVSPSFLQPSQLRNRACR